MGNVWAVKVSMELASSGTGWTELSSNGYGAAAAGRVKSPSCGPSADGCDFATLGQAYPHGTMLRITNPSNGRSGVWPLTDVGNGSSFGPAIGLTPDPAGALGASSGDIMHISLADGSDLNVVPGFGTLVSGAGGFTGGPPPPTTTATEGPVITRYNPSTIIRHDAFVLGEHGRRAYAGANTVRELLAGVDLVTVRGPRRGR